MLLIPCVVLQLIHKQAHLVKYNLCQILISYMLRYQGAILRGSFRSNVHCNFMLINFIYFTVLIYSTFP